jgi:hypothetical protein
MLGPHVVDVLVAQTSQDALDHGAFLRTKYYGALFAGVEALKG